jgi:hypothetical protein
MSATLKVIGTLITCSTDFSGYLVVAPASARGFYLSIVKREAPERVCEKMAGRVRFLSQTLYCKGASISLRVHIIPALGMLRLNEISICSSLIDAHGILV